MMRNHSILMALLFLSQPVWADCDYANDLLFQAYNLHGIDSAIETEKNLVKRAIQLCPKMPEAYNYLASLFKDQEDYEKAIFHYKIALELRIDFYQAWYNLGETYYKQGRFPLSLEAHLHACQSNSDSKEQVEVLLKSQHYAVTEAGKVIDKESLLVLFDPVRRKAINNMISKCGLQAKPIESVHIFRNLQFTIAKPGQQLDEIVVAQPGQQLDEIAAALRQLYSVVQPVNVAENESNAHANAVAHALGENGVSITRIKIRVLEPPLSDENSVAWAKNWGVEIKVD